MRNDQELHPTTMTNIINFLHPRERDLLYKANKKINTLIQETTILPTPLSSSQGIIHNILKTLKEDGLFEELFYLYPNGSTMAPEWSTLKTPKEKIQRICSFLTNRILKSGDKTEFNEFLEHNGIARLMTLLDYKFCDIDVDNTKVFPSNSISPDAKDPTNTVAGNRVGNDALTAEEKKGLIDDIFTTLHIKLSDYNKTHLDKMFSVIPDRSTKGTLKDDLGLAQATAAIDGIIKAGINDKMTNTRDSKIIATNLFIYYFNSLAMDDNKKIIALSNNNVLTYLVQNQPKIFMGLFDRLPSNSKLKIFNEIVTTDRLLSSEKIAAFNMLDRSWRPVALSGDYGEDLVRLNPALFKMLFIKLSPEGKARVLTSNVGEYVAEDSIRSDCSVSKVFSTELFKELFELLSSRGKTYVLSDYVGRYLVKKNKVLFKELFNNLNPEGKAQVLASRHTGGYLAFFKKVFFEEEFNLLDPEGKAQVLASHVGEYLAVTNEAFFEAEFIKLNPAGKAQVLASFDVGGYLVKKNKEFFEKEFELLNPEGKAQVLASEAGEYLAVTNEVSFKELFSTLDPEGKAQVLASYAGEYLSKSNEAFFEAEFIKLNPAGKAQVIAGEAGRYLAKNKEAFFKAEFNNLNLESKAQVLANRYAGEYLAKSNEAFLKAEFSNLNPEGKTYVLANYVGRFLAEEIPELFENLFTQLSPAVKSDVLASFAGEYLGTLSFGAPEIVDYIINNEDDFLPKERTCTTNISGNNKNLIAIIKAIDKTQFFENNLKTFLNEFVNHVNFTMASNEDYSEKKEKTILKKLLNHLQKDVKNFDLQQEGADTILHSIAHLFYPHEKGDYETAFDNAIDCNNLAKKLLTTPKNNCFLSSFYSQVDPNTRSLNEI
jgi:hypothetical protein